jgi:hypothetical protein
MKKSGDVHNGLTRASELLPGILPVGLQKERNGPTPVQRRLTQSAALNNEDPDLRSILYHHSTFCQAFFPYRDPGADVLSWNRSNGLVDLRLKAGEAKHPDGRWVQVPLPYGPKCRLVLMHINQLAIVNQSPHIVVEDSLTGFVRRVLNLDPKSRNINMVKEQLRRLATSSIRLGIASPDRSAAATRKLDIVTEFDVWFSKDDRQRVLWPSYIDLSLDYFASLQEHAVPLDERHIAALSHSALALDIYAWLAQRLHRVPANKPAFVSWTALHAQFGQGYNPEHMTKFRQVFRVALKQVLMLYKGARITEDERRPPQLLLQAGKAVWREPSAKGMILHSSPPPVSRRIITGC